MKLFKVSPLRMILSNQSGQAVVEYVLILIFSVTLLFLARGVFTGLNEFMTSYMGGYFKCLMVQGELPALNVSDADLSKHTSAGYKCTIGYDPSTIATGAGSGGTKNIGSTKAITTGKGSTKSTASSRGPLSAKSKSPLKPKKPTLTSGSDDDDTSFSSNIRNRSDAYSSADSDYYEEGVQSVSMSRNRIEDKPEKSRTITGKKADDILKNSRGVRPRQSLSKRIPLESEYRPGPRRNKLTPPARVIASAPEDSDDRFTFGDFFKWVMIAGIGILILVFFGGQILNYRNSEKG